MTFSAATLLAILSALLLCAALLGGWLMTLLGAPGNWLIVGATALYVALRGVEGPLTIGWPVVAVLFGIALLGEIVEAAAAAAGVARGGGSGAVALLALLGSMVGSMVGGLTGIFFVGLPIPLIGSLVAAVLFAAIGALAGAMLGEGWKGRSLDHSWRVGAAAFWGRVFGTLAKTLLGSVMVGVALAALVL